MDVPAEDIRGFTILDVGLVFSHVFWCQTEVNEGDLLSDLTFTFLEADHDILWLEIVIYSPSRMHNFETIQQLFTHGQYLLNLLQAITVKLLDIIL